ncbi:MAG TPA: ABC transporter ATP-binding protein [Trueperaceae bacterium]|nr:ABC transporter ATP-binding protein [Trueperaceae bacterium]
MSLELKGAAPTTSGRVPATPPAIRLRGVHKRYWHGAEQVKVLDGVDLDVAPGEFASLVGPSGAGKSTLLQIVAGLEAVTVGTVSIGGVVVTDLDEGARARLRLAHIGFVFQTFQLIPTLTALENAVLPLLLTGMARKPAAATGESVLSELGLTTRLDHLPEQLSVGEKQRVCMARAMVAGPSLLLADEPTANLDGPATDGVMRMLRRAARNRGMTVIMATHDARAAAYADTVFTLRGGKVTGGRGAGLA